jgi:uncharacterized protein (DUF427 family)
MVILFNTARVSGTQGANKVWKYRGQKRPPFAETPEAGQESVWDYPRPQAIVVDQRRVEVRLGNLIIADSRQNYRILETASPPTFYIPPHGIRLQLLEAFPGTSVCEWKGVAQYWGLKNCSGSLQAIGWSYPSPAPPFEAIANYFSFIRDEWSATLKARQCGRKRVNSTADGSRAKSSGHSRGVETRGTGSDVPGRREKGVVRDIIALARRTRPLDERSH